MTGQQEVSDWVVHLKIQLVTLCALEILALMGSAGFFILSVPAFWMFFINSLDTRPGEAGLFVVFAAYAADRLLLKHLRRCLSLIINTTVQPVRVPI